MKYLITGGCGFLGTNIAAALLHECHDVALFDNLSRHGSVNNLHWLRTLGNFNFTHGDIRNAGDCETLLAKFDPDVIFHFAGQVAMTTSIQHPRLDFEINALGTLNLLESIRTRCPHAAIIYSSTNKVYGDLEHLRYEESPTRYTLPDFPKGLPETVGLNFHSPYGCSKGSADQYVLDFARMYGLRTCAFRHSSMYGGRQFSTADQGWIGWFCEQAVRQADGHRSEFTIAGNGKQVRDILHCEDMVTLYLTAAQKIDRIAGQAFNIGGGGGNSLSILELMTLLEDILDTTLRWRHVEPRNSDQRVFVADLRKVESMLDWTPFVSKEDGIRRMVDWVRSLSLDGEHYE
jgi:CDP-paratose 2-epimerase